MNIGKITERLRKIGDDLELGVEERKLYFDISDKEWQMEDSGIEFNEITEQLEGLKELIFEALEQF